MTRARMIRAGLVLLPLLLMAGLAMASIVWAGASSSPALNWSVLSGGGAPVESSSGAVALNGTLGQTAIGLSDATYGSLGAGFWYGLGEGVYEVYLPVTLRNY